MTKLWDTIDRFDDGKKWIKDTVWHEGRNCLIGGMACADSDDYGCYDAIENTLDAAIIRDVILEQYPERVKGLDISETYNPVAKTLEWFNDDPNTTWEDVRLVLEKGAVRGDEFLSGL